MSENDQMSVLLDIREKIGELKGTLDGHVKAFDEHVKMDMLAYKAIGELKDKAATQKGYLTAMGAVGGGVVAALGYVIDRLFSGHH
jgi:hypothetical protein